MFLACWQNLKGRGKRKVSVWVNPQHLVLTLTRIALPLFSVCLTPDKPSVFQAHFYIGRTHRKGTKEVSALWPPMYVWSFELLFLPFSKLHLLEMLLMSHTPMHLQVLWVPQSSIVVPLGISKLQPTRNGMPGNLAEPPMCWMNTKCKSIYVQHSILLGFVLFCTAASLLFISWSKQDIFLLWISQCLHPPQVHCACRGYETEAHSMGLFEAKIPSATQEIQNVVLKFLTSGFQVKTIPFQHLREGSTKATNISLASSPSEEEEDKHWPKQAHSCFQACLLFQPAPELHLF